MKKPPMIKRGWAAVLPLTQRLPVSPETPMVTPSDDKAAELAAVRRIQNAFTFATGMDPREMPVPAVVGDE